MQIREWSILIGNTDLHSQVPKSSHCLGFQPNVKDTLHKLHANYVLAPADKAANNGLFHFLSVQGDGRKKFKLIIALDFSDMNILSPGKQLGEFSVSLEFHSELPTIFASFVLSKCQWM